MSRDGARGEWLPRSITLATSNQIKKQQKLISYLFRTLHLAASREHAGEHYESFDYPVKGKKERKDGGGKNQRVETEQSSCSLWSSALHREIKLLVAACVFVLRF